ncbi:pyridoxal phosphate phosphatase-related protein [Actinidia rufa]|uniref:Pyridoxal phosphate phosphatase-related protein n=1 Tax=Actinidia rufa TaxID=165716 RepID=A0A7J0FJ22_9ERIC|nr:pyridoxal phosphate phosphatase-related protein [Actinidia rufa]
MAGTTVVVFDFDHTIIEDNSDTWIVEEMGLTHLFDQLRRTLPWTALMDRMMEELHSQEKTVDEIAECLRRVPVSPRTVSAIKKAKALPGCELRIISDANQFFIETILKHYGLFDCFLEIVTNPSIIEEGCRLKILSYHDSVSSPHGCNLCPPNLCKCKEVSGAVEDVGVGAVDTFPIKGRMETEILTVYGEQEALFVVEKNCRRLQLPSSGGLVIEQIQASIVEKWKGRIIYLGDGRGDFCPSLKLGEGNYVMPRKDFPLWKKICDNRKLIKAEVHEWRNGEELEKILIRLIDTNSNEDNSEASSNPTQFNSCNCNIA